MRSIFYISEQQQQYLFAKMAGNQKGQLPIKAGSLQRKHEYVTILSFSALTLLVRPCSL